MKLGTNIRHVSGHRCRGFQGQRSKVKIIAIETKCTFAADAIYFDGVASRLLFDQSSLFAVVDAQTALAGIQNGY